MNTFSNLVEHADATFLVRWRGKQSGPFSPSALDAKLASNEIGLLHEIQYNGKWVTIRDYINEREQILQAQMQAQAAQERAEQEAAQRREQQLQEQHRAALLAEERRRNDLLESAARPTPMDASQPAIAPRSPLKAHRASLILTLGLLGLFVCGPLCLAAWIMGAGDLAEMDAGLMDPSGRSTTNTGKTLGFAGIMLWVAGFIYIFFLRP